MNFLSFLVEVYMHSCCSFNAMWFDIHMGIVRSFPVTELMELWTCGCLLMTGIRRYVCMYHFCSVICLVSCAVVECDAVYLLTYCASRGTCTLLLHFHVRHLYTSTPPPPLPQRQILYFLLHYMCLTARLQFLIPFLYSENHVSPNLLW